MQADRQKSICWALDSTLIKQDIPSLNIPENTHTLQSTDTLPHKNLFYYPLLDILKGPVKLVICSLYIFQICSLYIHRFWASCLSNLIMVSSKAATFHSTGVEVALVIKLEAGQTRVELVQDGRQTSAQSQQLRPHAVKAHAHGTLKRQTPSIPQQRTTTQKETERETDINHRRKQVILKDLHSDVCYFRRSCL